MWMRHHRPDSVESAVGFVGEERGPERQPAVVVLVDPPAEPAAEAPVPKAVRDEAELVTAAIALVQVHGFCLLGRPPCPWRWRRGTRTWGLAAHIYPSLHNAS